MKIAFISFYSGEVYRGVETHVHELANRLVDLGNEVVVYQNGKAISGTKYKTRTLRFEVDGQKSTASLYWPILIGRHAMKVFGEMKNDVDVVIPTNGGLQTLFARLWTIWYRKKIIIVGHSGPGGDDKWNLLCFPDYFVGLTEWQSKWAKKFNPFVKTKTIPNGVDLGKFSSAAKSLKTNLPKPIILHVGALDDWKRQDLAIRAVAKLNSASLLLVGRGAKEKELKDLGGKLLPGRFEIMSFPHNEMPKVYGACDIFTYPTVSWESFGLVLLEAMASGLPVVANDDSIRREIVGDAGLFVDPTDTEKYAVALEKALRTKWGSIPRKQAEKFDWEKIAKRYEKLFLDLV